ncbi:hypothetical protein [Paraburkholderia caribensis]|uniref:hypothetical protein n=1 Tax=Paraburkholderia caribensis TaxID=75105 RepID=UPI00078E7829|nr:hypothetical protein [Paraburkholderia caribensis]AMV47796.1 hypothetical protein ATN79_44830 [Paraburkholderia caribensis]
MFKVGSKILYVFIGVLAFLLLVFFAMARSAKRDAEQSRHVDWIVVQWTEMMRTYNINPVYPPTEDIHVGDVFGLSNDVDPQTNSPKDGGLFSTAKVAFVPMQKQLETYYSAVPVFPETPAQPASEAGIWRQLPAGSSCKGDSCTSPDDGSPPQSVFEPAGKLTRLSIVALPGFSINRAMFSKVEAGFPQDMFKAVLGGSASNDDIISIKVHGAETYGVPAMDALIALKLFCSPSKKTSLECYHSNVSTALGSASGAAPSSTSVAIVYRLYMTRSIEYTFGSSSAIGMQAKVLLDLQKEAANREVAVAKAAAASAGSAPSDVKPKTASEAMEAARSKLEQSLEEQTSARAIPGGTLSVGSISDSGVSIIETFERPVAIGYRSVVLPTIEQ